MSGSCAKMGENGMREPCDNDDNFAVKRQRTPATSDEDDDLITWLAIDDDTVAELTKLLDPEVISPVKVKFIDNPYSSPLIFQSSSAYITINGNEESCGSSFSDSECSVMASIDMRDIRSGRSMGGDGVFTTACSVGALGFEDEKALGVFMGYEEDCSVIGTHSSDFWDNDDDDDDDDMLARFLGGDFIEASE